MYSVNGIALDNPGYGWTMMRASQVLTGLTKGLASVTIPGRKGVLSGIPSYAGAPTSTIVVKTHDVGLETLYRLFGQNDGVGFLTITADTSRSVLFEVASISPSGINGFDETILVTISLRHPTADWRDVALTTHAPATETNAIANYSILSGISSDISDADIFVGGNFTNFELDDVASGSWVKTVKTWPYVSGTGVLFRGSTGQAYRANVSAPWTPTADMTEYVDVSGGGGFRISPDPSGGDPSVGIASLKLITASQTSLTFGWRAYNSYLLRNGDI